MSDTYSVLVGPKGRIVIPVEIRRQLGIEEGAELVAVVEPDGVTFMRREAVKRRLRGLFGSVPGSLSAELMHERRAAAADESRDE